MLPIPTRHLQIHIQQVVDASNPRTGICKSNSSKLQILPTLTRHLQIQIQQAADTSEPDQASAAPILANCRYFHIRNSPLYVSTNPIPANCRCFQPRPGIYKSNTSKLQILPRPEFTPICIYKSNTSKLQILPTPTRHLQLQFQQVADASNPDQASTNPIPANCRYFRSRSGICKSPKQQIKDAHR